MKPNFKNRMRKKKIPKNYLELDMEWKNGKWRNATRYSECVAVLFYLVSQSLRFWSNNFDQQVKRQPCNDTYRTTLDFVVETWYWFIPETTCRTMKTPVHFTCPIWRKYYSLLENSFKHISRRSPGQDFFIAPALKQILF